MMSFSAFEDDLNTLNSDSSREAEFLRELAACYRDMYSCAMVVAGSQADADDVIQEACVVLWQKYDEFNPESCFKKWACSITFNVAKAYARKQRRRRGHGLPDDVLANVVRMCTAGSELFELRSEILKKCLARLSVSNRNFLIDCYQNANGIATVARKQNRTMASVYSKLKRIRQMLSECVKNQMKQWGS